MDDEHQLAVAAAHRQASAAFILALLGFVFPVICSLPGALFGMLAYRKLRHLPDAPGGGRAIAAIALGVAQLVFTAVMVATGAV